MYKPDTYNSVSPYLISPKAEQIIDFLKNVFGATELRRFDRPDGSIMHAEVRIDDSVVMMGSTGDGGAANYAHLHVYVKDVDETYKRALEAGGDSVKAPEQEAGDPDKRGGVKGPGGNTWWISTQIHT